MARGHVKVTRAKRHGAYYNKVTKKTNTTTTIRHLPNRHCAAFSELMELVKPKIYHSCAPQTPFQKMVRQLGWGEDGEGVAGALDAAWVDFGGK